MSEVLIYTTDDGVTKVDLRLDQGTGWLTQLQIAELFQTTKQNISKHIQAILADGELTGQATVNQQLTVQQEGGREVSRRTTFYKLDMVLAEGAVVKQSLTTAVDSKAYSTEQNIALYLKRIFAEGELAGKATVKEYLTVQMKGKQ